MSAGYEQAAAPAKGKPPKKQVEQYQARLTRLKSEFSTWREHAREISDYVLPRRSRFLTNERNRGTKKNSKINNSVATQAIEVSTAGLMSGLTSPSRPWFKWEAWDPALMEDRPVLDWNEDVTRGAQDLLHRSNFYGCAQTFYESLLAFPSAAMGVERDDESILRFHVFPFGSYYLATSPRGIVDTIYREFSMTVGQMVKKFGRDRCSRNVQSLYDNGQIDEWIDLCHAIQPNDSYDSRKLSRSFMPFTSCFFEVGGDPDKVLSEGGFRRFPVLVARWTTTGEDVYGSSPAMKVLPDVKALQVLESQKLTMLEKILDPAYKAPVSLERKGVRTQPGSVTYVDELNPNAKLEAIHVPDHQALGAARVEIEAHERRIWEGLFANVFLMVSQIDAGAKDMTAAEIYAREREQMAQLGPIVERQYDEFIKPLLDIVFDVMAEEDLLPEIPRELQGVELRTVLISSLAQAQRATETSGIEAVTSFATSVAQVPGFESIADKFDADEALDRYNAARGGDSSLVRTDEQVAALREQRAQQAQAAQLPDAAKAAQAGAGAAKDLSETQVGGGSALDALMEGAA